MSAIPVGRAVPALLPRARVGSDQWLLRAVLLASLGFLLLAVAGPLLMLMIKSLYDKHGAFVGLGNYARFFADPGLRGSIGRSLAVAGATTVTTLPLGFLFAYGLTRTAIPGKAVLRIILLLPLLAPTLLPALSLIYLFGNQGLLKGFAPGGTIYGFSGILIGEVFSCFPHATLILLTALAAADARLYEAARSMKTPPWRRFLTITLPGARFGAISALFVVFTRAITDFGVPKVIGGHYGVLATDIYKSVIGQQDFGMGAVTGGVLLVPAALAFLLDRLAQQQQSAQISARAVPYQITPNRWLDGPVFIGCSLIALFIAGLIGIAGWGSFIQYWPYNLSLTLDNYDFETADASGWRSFWHSLEMAGATAVFGTIIAFLSAYALERCRGWTSIKSAIQLLAYLPVAVPGLVLGLSYIFFFNAPDNPLNFLYGSIAILSLNCVAHYYTVGHLTALTALKQLDPDYENVSASLKVPVWVTFWRVTVPVSLPTIINMATYLFLCSLTAISAMIFLYGPHTTLASIASVHMEEAGAIAPAAAMAMMIVYAAIALKLLQSALTRGVERRLQAWRRLSEKDLVP